MKFVSQLVFFSGLMLHYVFFVSIVFLDQLWTAATCQLLLMAPSTSQRPLSRLRLATSATLVTIWLDLTFAIALQTAFGIPRHLVARVRWTAFCDVFK